MRFNIVLTTTFQRAALVSAAVFWLHVLSTPSRGQVYSPVQLDSALPYRVELREYSMGMAALPTLHSFAVGHFDNKWLFISGRTNGLHGFDFDTGPPGTNFPTQFQNREVWVLDLATQQTWHKPLDHGTSGLSEAQIVSLANTNNQFYQKGDTLYISGGYGVNATADNFVTFDTLSAIDVAGLGDWVVNGTGTAAGNLRQLQNPAFQVTGGAMHELNGRTHIVFGQDFFGAYNPSSEGAYTSQVRSFDIVDDGTNTWHVENIQASTPDPANFRRRDLNVVPTIRPDGSGGEEQALLALSGVFTELFGPWTQPVEIGANGSPEVADLNDFNQAMNNYHSAKMGFYSQQTEEMHEVLFGGISLKYLDPSTQMIETDDGLPFVNDITSIAIDADGNYSQHHLGFFPELFDTDSKRLRFGTNAEFLPADGVPTFANGVIDFDALSGATTVGYIYGGIMTNGPHTRAIPPAISSASNHIFEVVLVPVPEPATLALVVMSVIIGVFLRRRR